MSVERQPMAIDVIVNTDGGSALGGVIIGNDIAIPLHIKSRVVVVSVGESSISLTRDEAITLADIIRSAAHDG